ncbi:ABC transporter substrate-binding protein [Sedimentibacter sp. zth1]|uniref:ABC transporter substrate-binding protein n=1 Tax=Sedimentibacter sp. zth1 TaxID=2816908 RepID=UPI001A9229B7|nr:ABC transporter substrate-binding protein [Sedimentibacter sp. zth1]QSX04723.1 ABC transporter substrate-binding protein [Sedimentibacter sp. zth1]
MKKILACILVLTLLLSITACQKDEETPPVNSGESKVGENEGNNEGNNEDNDEDVNKGPSGSITLGSTTELSGDFFTSMWGNNAQDALVKDLIHGYGTIGFQRETAAYGVDTTVVKDLKAIKNNDGTKTFEIEINNDLTYCDGTQIKAKDYVFSILFMSHPEVADMGADTSNYIDFVGYDEFNERPEDSEEGQVSEVFTGVRLLGDYKFSVVVKAEKLPYFYDEVLASVSPTPIKVLAPNADVKDEGDGAKITGEFTTEILEKTISDTDTGYRYNPKVTCGPYMLDKMDQTTKIAILKANPNYKGDYNGQKPQIAQIVIKKVNAATQIDELVAGDVDILSKVGGKDGILPGLDAVDNGSIQCATFPRCGYGKITFICDIGPTQFIKVRQAIAHCLDVPEFARQYSGGYASTVNGAYGVAQWMYKDNAAKIGKEFNKYALNIAKAEELLIEDGWTLNEKGNEFVKGTDTIRHKMVDGELMPLLIKHLATTNNPVSDLLSTMLPANMESIGMSYEQTAVEFPVLLDNLYGDVPERIYNMMNLATGFSPVYDPFYSYNTEDRYMGISNCNYIRDDELMSCAKKMRETEPSDKEGYSEKWYNFQKRWNEVLPDVPLYSDEYHAFFSKKLKNYDADSFWTFRYAILYANVEE